MQKFERYEFKYVIPDKLCVKIEEQISNFMKFDYFSKKNKSNSYFVRSLYYENEQNNNFYDKIDGIKYREKYRFRTYEKRFNKNIYLEKKIKDNERVFKNRIRITSQQFKKIISENFYSLENNMEEKEFLKEFIFKVLKNRESPKIVIDYVRKPYINEIDQHFRISIDSELTARDIDLNFAKKCLPGYRIIEVKFYRRIPLWFHRIIQSYNLRRVSISKFVVGMKCMNYAIDLS